MELPEGGPGLSGCTATAQARRWARSGCRMADLAGHQRWVASQWGRAYPRSLPRQPGEEPEPGQCCACLARLLFQPKQLRSDRMQAPACQHRLPGAATRPCASSSQHAALRSAGRRQQPAAPRRDCPGRPGSLPPPQASVKSAQTSFSVPIAVKGRWVQAAALAGHSAARMRRSCETIQAAGMAC